MKPVLGITVHPQIHAALDGDYLTDLLNRALDREFGAGEFISVRLLTTEDDLRAYQAGELILYRKPARRRGNTITFRKDGREHRLEQTVAFPDK